MFLTNCRKIFETTLTIETALSDFHKLIVTVPEVKHENVPPKITQYGDYKNFNSARFFERLQVRLTHLDMNSLDFGNLKKCFTELFNKVAPLKAKFLGTNHSKFVTKDQSNKRPK